MVRRGFVCSFCLVPVSDVLLGVWEAGKCWASVDGVGKGGAACLCAELSMSVSVCACM